MTLNKFIIKFTKNREDVQLNYIVHDSELAQNWFKKIKHLKHIPIDPVESLQCDLSDIDSIYLKFCKFAGIDHVPITTKDQQSLNRLHEIYEKTHNELSKKINNDIIYRFHHAIHDLEKKYNYNAYHPHGFGDNIIIGWGVKEGPLTTKFNCNKFYEKTLDKNAIYLPWAELGKTPLIYWHDNEPNDNQRFLELVKPHITFRATFQIMLDDRSPLVFNRSFEIWFKKFQQQWLEKHRLDDWRNIDEYSAPLLAYPDHKEDIRNLTQMGYRFSGLA